MSDYTALYRAWSVDAELLYVGTSRSPRQRLKQHAKEKPWWGEVGHVEHLWYSRQWRAELAEQSVISRQCPPHNRMMPPWRAPMPNEQCDLWRGWFDTTAERVFALLAAGASLEAVAKAADWSPRYIVRLGRQRHHPWAVNYSGPYDDMPKVGYLYSGSRGSAVLPRSRGLPVCADLFRPHYTDEKWPQSFGPVRAKRRSYRGWCALPVERASGAKASPYTGAN